MATAYRDYYGHLIEKPQPVYIFSVKQLPSHHNGLAAHMKEMRATLAETLPPNVRVVILPPNIELTRVES